MYRRIYFRFAILSLMFVALPAFGQGACPSGFPISGNNCYFVSAQGSDSNNGTSESTPWQHAPGMPNCTATCKATTVKPGNAIVFRGNDTYHRSASTNSSTDVAIGGQWTWGASGSSSGCNYPSAVNGCTYLGVDKNWYSGASWGRPKVSMDNPIWANSMHKDSSHTGFVTACTYDDHSTVALSINASYVVLDNFEFMGKCWSTYPVYNSASEIYRSGNYIAIINSYFHGWTEVYIPTTGSPGPMDQATIIAGGGVSVPNVSHNVLAYDVFDGSDTVCTGWGACTGGPVEYGDAYDVHNCVVRYIANGFNSPSNTVTMHDNLFEYVYESYDPYDHGAVIEMYPYAGALPDGQVTSIYNNIFRNIGIGEIIETTTANQGTTNVFNNTIWNVQTYSGGGANNCIYVEQTNSALRTTYNFYNNTIDALNGPCKMRISNTQNPFNGTINVANDHFIGYSSLSDFELIETGGTPTVNDLGGTVFQTEAAANAQGYTTSNNYQPTASNNATVHAATNQTSSCALFSADSALCNGSKGGVTSTSGTGAIPIGYIPSPAPRGNMWDAGAYRYSGQNPPSPPTGLRATAQ